MQPSQSPSSFWTNWLLAVSIGVSVFGLILVIAPALSMQGFSLLVYFDPRRIASFDHEATRYISLAHAVLGAVMFGWGLALVAVVRTLFAAGLRTGWNIIAISVGGWFIPDTTYSLLSGYWQNAVLNLAFLLLFALPLVVTHKAFRANGA
jgi:hypothetical protein